MPDVQQPKSTNFADNADDRVVDLRTGVSAPTGSSVSIDDTQRLNELTGDEFALAAARLGLVVTERGVFADPDHAARTFVSVDEAEDQLKDLFARHGVTWSADPMDTTAAGS